MAKALTTIFVTVIAMSAIAWGGYVTTGAIKSHSIADDVAEIKKDVKTLMLRGY